MFKHFYGMSTNPFEKGIKEKDAYQSKDLKEMISRLEYLNENRGIGLFTAAPGSGKTFALRCFAKKVNPNLTKVMDCQHLLGQFFLGQNCLVFNRTKIS